MRKTMIVLNEFAFSYLNCKAFLVLLSNYNGPVEAKNFFFVVKWFVSFIRHHFYFFFFLHLLRWCLQTRGLRSFLFMDLTFGTFSCNIRVISFQKKLQNHWNLPKLEIFFLRISGHCYFFLIVPSHWLQFYLVTIWSVILGSEKPKLCKTE